MSLKIKFLEKVSKNEDINYDNYFKVVYTSSILINDQKIDFKFTEEDGMGVTLEIKDDNKYKKVSREDNFEYLFIEELFSQSPIDFDSIIEGEEIELNFDYYEDDGIIERVVLHAATNNELGSEFINPVVILPKGDTYKIVIFASLLIAITDTTKYHLPLLPVQVLTPKINGKIF